MNLANGHKDPQVASLEEARRRAAQKAKAAKAASRPGGPRTTRDWLIGGVIVAMALGLIVHWVMGLAPSTMGVP